MDYKNIPYEKTGYYTVKKGDSLWTISKDFNTTVNELKQLNNLTSNTLSIGQQLKIPTEEIIEPNIPTDSNTYIVKSGDNLYSIAKKYDITVDNLKTTNNLTSNTLSIGQVLKIPGTSIEEPNTHTVSKGESLYSIANKYGTTVNELKQLNNLTSNTLSIGQILKLPGTTEESTINTYTVKSGDTLYKIANKYNLTVNELKELNNLTSNTLSIGQTLKIRETSSDIITEDYDLYTVKNGDTLYFIANKYNTTVDEIKKLNNLTDNTLSIGQLIKIPTTENIYTVKKGDTLWSIAQNNNTTVDNIKNINNLIDNSLTIGQQLLLS